MNFNIIIGILPFIIPYTYLGENLSSLLLSIIGLVYLFFNNNKEDINKKFMISLMLLNIVAIVSLIFNNFSYDSFSGYTIYLNMIIYYIIYSKINKESTNVLRDIVYIVAGLCVIFIIIQGLYNNIRIYGNIGYANSYALLLFVAYFFNILREKDKFVDIIEIVLVIGILYTGSRTTLILLLGSYIFRLIQKDEKFNLQNPIFAFIIYYVCSLLNLKALLVVPIIIYVYWQIKNIKINKFIIIALAIMSVGIFTLGSSNTTDRLKNISLKNASLQERFVYYEDSLKSIKNKPMGEGINTFKYKSYKDSSAFYDVKYIHNSIIQIAYDIGVIGSIIFIIILIFSVTLLIRNRGNKLVILLFLFIIIHSLLDFDMAYGTFGIILVMLVSLYGEGGKDTIKFSKFLSIPIITVLAFVSLYEGTLYLGNAMLVNNKNKGSDTCLNIADKISFGVDYRSLFLHSSVYKNFYDENNDNKNLDKSLDYLMESYNINNENPLIIWNIVYINQKLDNEDEVIKYMDDLINLEKYNPEVYNLFYDYFNDKYKNTNNNDYKKICDEINNKKEEAKSTRNNKAIYLKNQI